MKAWHFQFDETQFQSAYATTAVSYGSSSVQLLLVQPSDSAASRSSLRGPAAWPGVGHDHFCTTLARSGHGHFCRTPGRGGHGHLCAGLLPGPAAVRVISVEHRAAAVTVISVEHRAAAVTVISARARCLAPRRAAGVTIGAASSLDVNIAGMGGRNNMPCGGGPTCLLRELIVRL